LDGENARSADGMAIRAGSHNAAKLQVGLSRDFDHDRAPFTGN
jgi:hypothetical protein